MKNILKKIKDILPALKLGKINEILNYTHNFLNIFSINKFNNILPPN